MGLAVLAVGLCAGVLWARADDPQEDQRKLVRTRKGMEYRGVVRAYGQRYIKVITKTSSHRIAREDLDGNPRPTIESPGFDPIGAREAMADAERERRAHCLRPAMVHYWTSLLSDPSQLATWQLWQYSSSSRNIELRPRMALRTSDRAFGALLVEALGRLTPAIQIDPSPAGGGSGPATPKGSDGEPGPAAEPIAKGYEFGLLAKARTNKGAGASRAVAGRLALYSLASKRRVWTSQVHPVDMTLQETALSDKEKKKLWVTGRSMKHLAGKLTSALLEEYLQPYEVHGRTGPFTEKKDRALLRELKDLLRRRNAKSGARGTRDRRLVETLIIAWLVPSLSDRALTQAIEISPVMTRRVLVGWVCLPTLPKHLVVPMLQCLSSVPEEGWEEVVQDPDVKKIVAALTAESSDPHAKLAGLRELLAPGMVTEAVCTRKRRAPDQRRATRGRDSRPDDAPTRPETAPPARTKTDSKSGEASSPF